MKFVYFMLHEKPKDFSKRLAKTINQRNKYNSKQLNIIIHKNGFQIKVKHIWKFPTGFYFTTKYYKKNSKYFMRGLFYFPLLITFFLVIISIVFFIEVFFGNNSVDGLFVLLLMYLNVYISYKDVKIIDDFVLSFSRVEKIEKRFKL